MAVLEPTNLLLLACAVLYGLLGEPADAAVLLLFVAAITLLDAVQQHRSNRALAELARLSAPRARLRRNGVDLDLPADQVRPGDLLRLEEGDRVAADGRLLEGVGLWLDESLITGESLPVERQQAGARILAGSLVASGRGLAAVEAVAGSTELGRLGRSLAAVEAPPTPLQRQSRRLTGRVTGWALGLCTALTLVQVAAGGQGEGRAMEALLAGLALALAVLPNEIPVVIALFLALGALRLSRIGVLARWPAAVESLGSATVLAVDKTGTLTENRMAVQGLLTWPAAERWNGEDPLPEAWHGLLELAVLASRGDPVDAMEQAIQRLASEQLGGSEHLHPDWPLLREYPLQSDLLVFSRLWRDGEGSARLAAKGAPEAIAALCHLEPAAAARWQAAADGMASDGLRVLGVARGLDGLPRHGGAADGQAAGPGDGALPEHVHDVAFKPVGLIGLADGLRPDVPAAITSARAAGVRVVMITGDGPVTARAIADQAGLPPGPVCCGEELRQGAAATGGGADLADKSLVDKGLVETVRRVSVFARVLPQQKLALVRALQAAGDVVAMTGDGVNDAAALKAADIGVAMGRRGTAVARESADLVLLNDRFTDLVAALALGRRVDANLQRALAYTLAIHLPIATLALVPLLHPAGGLILLPVHIALLHLVIDPACTVVFEGLPGAPALMQQPPRPPGRPLLDPPIWHRALLQGGALSAAALALAFWPGTDPDTRRSLVFSLLLLGGGGLVAIVGERRRGATAAGLLLGGGLWGLLMVMPPLQRALALAPLHGADLAGLLGATGLALLLALLAGRNDRARP